MKRRFNKLADVIPLVKCRRLSHGTESSAASRQPCAMRLTTEWRDSERRLEQQFGEILAVLHLPDQYFESGAAGRRS